MHGYNILLYVQRKKRKERSMVFLSSFLVPFINTLGASHVAIYDWMRSLGISYVIRGSRDFDSLLEIQYVADASLLDPG